MTTIRLDKLLATRGVAARRKCDTLIESGVVRVNGEVITAPGARVIEERDEITVNGRPLPGRAEQRYLLLHKPVGVITTLSDPEGRRTIRDLLPKGTRLFPVGRLDADTSGLLIVTNDGDLAHHLMHPRYGLTKFYRVLLERAPDPAQLDRLARGVEFEPGIHSAPARVRLRDPVPRGAVIEIALHEGRHRQVRRMCEAVGLRVLGLHRWAYGPLRLGEVERGMWRDLSEEEVARLRASSARPQPRPASMGPRGRVGSMGPRGRTAVRTRPSRRDPDRGPRAIGSAPPSMERGARGRNARMGETRPREMEHGPRSRNPRVRDRAAGTMEHGPRGRNPRVRDRAARTMERGARGRGPRDMKRGVRAARTMERGPRGRGPRDMKRGVRGARGRSPRLRERDPRVRDRAARTMERGPRGRRPRTFERGSQGISRAVPTAGRPGARPRRPREGRASATGGPGGRARIRSGPIRPFSGARRPKPGRKGATGPRPGPRSVAKRARVKR